MKIVTVDQMRELEQRSDALGVSYAQMMEDAGRATARAVRDLLGGAAGRRVLVLVGPGNNGGDGLVTARYLHDWGAAVQVVLAAPRPADDPNWHAITVRDIASAEAPATAVVDAWAAQAAVVVDAFLGTGRSRPLEGPLREVLDRVRGAVARRAAPVVAVDLPTGVDADSGAVDPAALPATLTVTFAHPKPGHLRHPGAALSGRLLVVDIGIPAALADPIRTELVDAGAVRGLLPSRPADSNKGTFGRALIAAGCSQFMGAAVLACQGALRSGAGLVTLAAPPAVGLVAAAALLEATHLPLQATPEGGIAGPGAAAVLAALPQYTALLVGCGLGQEPGTREFVERLLLNGAPLPAGVVVDADALNLLAGFSAWWPRLPVPAVLTPHPGEMARLLGSSVAAVQAGRWETAAAAAARWGKVVVLKGAHTVVAAPDGRLRVSPFANPVLATAGTGDVLAGTIAGLLAQGAEPFDAAVAGVFLHGAAGERFARSRGDTGLVASDLARLLPSVIREVRRGAAEPPWLRHRRRGARSGGDGR